MRVLFVTFPWKTHFFLSVPLAWALQTAGHEVRVASEPALTGTITGAGLTAVEVGSPQTVQERGAATEGKDVPARKSPEGTVDSLYEIGGERERIAWDHLTWLDDFVFVPRVRFINDGMVEDLVAYCRSWEPDLILWDAVTNAGAVAAEVVGAAHGRVLFTLDLSRRLRDDFLWAKERQPAEARQDGMKDWYAEWLAKYGCEYSEELMNGQFTIDQLPGSFKLDPGEPSVSMRYIPYNGASVVPKWVNEDAPARRVLMTFGITGREMPEENVVSIDQIQEILDSLADLDIELVATLPAELQDKLSRIPENTKIVEFVPFNAIISSCSAVINHGGAGTFNNALLSGVPQVLITNAPDARSKNTLIEERSVGVPVPPAEVSGPRVREALVRVLEDPSFRAGAERVRQEMLGQPSPNDLVTELESLTAKYRFRGQR